MATIVTRAGKGSPLSTVELDANFTNLNTDKLEINAALGTPASVTLTNATGLPTSGLVDNAVTNAKLRDSGALSVIGRSANSTGDPADIAAGTDHQVFRRSGTSLGFGALALNQAAAITGTLPVANGGTGLTSYTAGSVVHSEDGTSLTSGIKFGTAPEEIVLNQFLSGMAYQDPDNVTIGGGSATLTSLTATTVTGTSMVYNGAELSARLNPLAQAVSVQMTASTTVGGIQQLDNVNNNFATGDFTVSTKVLLPDWTTTAVVVFCQNKTAIDATPGFRFFYSASRTLALRVGASAFTSAVSLASLAGFNEVAASVIAPTALVAGSVSFYVNGVLQDSVVIAAGTTFNSTSTTSAYILGTETLRSAGSLQSSRLFNRALTAAQVLDLSINGVALADRGAGQTPVSSDTAWTGATGATPPTGWTIPARSGTFTIVADAGPAGAGDFCLDIADDGVNNNPVIRKQITVTPGKRYSFEASSKNGTADSYSIFAGTSTNVGGYASFTGLTDADWTKRKAEFIPTEATLLLQINVTTTTPGQNARFDDFILKQIGLTSELIASNAQSNTGQILDSSGNKNHALLPASGATVVGRPVSQTREVRWTNTWAGTNELQYIGGVNQAILPANAYIESIIGTVSGATPHDIIVGDGSDADRYVTITTGLAAGTTSFTLANRTTDGTNLKLTVDPDTNATMSIAWVISYRTLEA